MSSKLTFKPQKTLSKYQREALQDLLNNTKHEKINKRKLNKIFPVGSIYFSFHGEDPNEVLIGYWEQFNDSQNYYIRKR